MLQVDLPLLATLTKDFNIDWYFWGNRESSTGKTALKYAEDNNIPLNFIEKGRFIFHPGNFFDQKEIIKVWRNWIIQSIISIYLLFLGCSL